VEKKRDARDEEQRSKESKTEKKVRNPRITAKKAREKIEQQKNKGKG